MSSHFCVCILPSKGPLNAALLPVTAQLPSIHFGGECSTVRQVPVKALAVKNTDLDFSRVEPAGTFDSFSISRLLLQTRFNPKFVSRKIGAGAIQAASCLWICCPIGVPRSREPLSTTATVMARHSPGVAATVCA